MPQDDRIGIASAALQKAINMLNKTTGHFSDVAAGNFGAAATLFAQMAELDRLTNQTLHKDNLKGYFRHAKRLHTGLNYGYAAARAYAVYGDRYFLDIAQTSWASARRYTISSEQASSRTMEAKKFTLTSSCKNAALAGGTYFNTDRNTPYLNSLASGLFLVVSALLAEAMHNQTYIEAAAESAEFIQSHLLTQSNIVQDSIGSSSNHSSSCSVKTLLVPDGSGTFIEGLGILAGIRHNSSTESLLNRTIFNVTADPLWQGVDGVYKNSDDGGHYIVRALASLYERNKTSSDLREHIKEYISVQYNSVVVNATSLSESYIYGSPWTKSTATLFDSVTQTSALTVLLGAIQLDGQSSSNLGDNPTSRVIPTSSVGTSLPPQSSTSSGVNPDNSSRSASSTQKNSAGIIAGGVVGGIALLAVLTMGALFLRKLHHQRRDNPSVVDASSSMVTPFMATQNMASSGILGEQHRRNRVKSARFPGVAMGREPSSRAADNGSVGIPGANVRTEPTASPGNQVGSTDNPPAGGRREHTLLEELLRSLNDRISRDRWNTEELPPDYHEGQAM
ncbi:uncharacterized protein ARMOST_20904 [Armillaria ostoyae]|uniref:Glycoside hydrolase family 76 protein n=1 Tax=Armillaria ostoyae TaxID=47428 RepID=A0A284S8M4_ARMOS|nr:uncharacterized protein ARMOST_20904 [Armillaria ostoyae]